MKTTDQQAESYENLKSAAGILVKAAREFRETHPGAAGAIVFAVCAILAAVILAPQAWQRSMPVLLTAGEIIATDAVPRLKHEERLMKLAGGPKDASE